jgi:hypothetical protein
VNHVILCKETNQFGLEYAIFIAPHMEVMRNCSPHGTKQINLVWNMGVDQSTTSNSDCMKESALSLLVAWPLELSFSYSKLIMKLCIDIFTNKTRP